MDRAVAIQSLRRLHEAQTAFYAGGPAAPFRELLTGDVVWRVPGDNAVAGTYTGIDAVVGYFARRRDLAARTFRMHPGEVLIGAGDHAAVMTDGTAILHGEERSWSTGSGQSSLRRRRRAQSRWSFASSAEGRP